jgi:hypothetical protein
MDMLSNQPTPLQLSGQQLALHRALGKTKTELADMYYGALSVLSQIENPDRLALAAHGFREIMEKLPRYLDLPSTNPSSLTEQVRTLNQGWEKVLKQSECHDNGMWTGNIDESLQKFLKIVHEFFDWLKLDRPTRKQQAARVLRELDPLGRPLPEPIESLRVKEWDSYRSYFDNVAHHNPSASPEKFESWLSESERFLLDRLIPRTFEDRSKIDDIIKEGEG